MSTGAVKASAAQRKEVEAERQRQHEAEMTRMILDWITVTRPKRGDVIVLTVPKESFVWPGTAAEDVTEEQSAMMEACHKVLGELLEAVHRSGVLPGGAAILGEGMTLSDLPPPWEKHPDAREPSEHLVVPGKSILLPPGTKI